MWTDLMLLVFLILVTFFQAIGALHDGAPSMACSSMTPFHFAFEAQPLAQCPFTVRQSKLRYRSRNDTVTVTLSVKDTKSSRAFKGYLVKAINPLTNHTIGQFREQSGVNLRPVCHAATHSSASNKHRVVLHWTPDDADEEDNWVVFEATFVETFRKFYVRIQSTFRTKPARSMIDKMLDKETDEVTTESFISSENEIEKQSEKGLEVEFVDEHTTTQKPKRNKHRESRDFWF